MKTKIEEIETLFVSEDKLYNFCAMLAEAPATQEMISTLVLSTKFAQERGQDSFVLKLSPMVFMLIRKYIKSYLYKEDTTKGAHYLVIDEFKMSAPVFIDWDSIYFELEFRPLLDGFKVEQFSEIQTSDVFVPMDDVTKLHLHGELTHAIAEDSRVRVPKKKYTLQ